MKYHKAEFIPDIALVESAIVLIRTDLVTHIATDAGSDLCLAFVLCAGSREERTQTVSSDTSFENQVEGTAQLRFAKVRRGFAKNEVVIFSLECKFSEEPAVGSGLSGFTASGEFEDTNPTINHWTGLYNQFETPWYGWRGE